MYLRGLKKENEVSNLKREKERCQVIINKIITFYYHIFLVYFFLILFFLGVKKQYVIIFLRISFLMFFIGVIMLIYFALRFKISERRINEIYVMSLINQNGNTYVNLGNLNQYTISETKKYMILISKKKKKKIFIFKHFPQENLYHVW